MCQDSEKWMKTSFSPTMQKPAMLNFSIYFLYIILLHFIKLFSWLFRCKSHLKHTVTKFITSILSPMWKRSVQQAEMLKNWSIIWPRVKFYDGLIHHRVNFGRTIDYCCLFFSQQPYTAPRYQSVFQHGCVSVYIFFFFFFSGGCIFFMIFKVLYSTCENVWQ